MAKFEITAELNLQNLIDETRETAEALYELADNLERIKKKYAHKSESEDKCKKCEYYSNPDYTRCRECEAESEDEE